MTTTSDEESKAHEAKSCKGEKQSSSSGDPKGLFADDSSPKPGFFRQDIDERFEYKWNERVIRYGTWLATIVLVIILAWMFDKIWVFNTEIASVKEKILNIEKHNSVNAQINKPTCTSSSVLCDDFWSSALKFHLIARDCEQTKLGAHNPSNGQGGGK